MTLDIRAAGSGSVGFTRHGLPVHDGPNLVVSRQLAVQGWLPACGGAEARVDEVVQP